MRIAQVSPLFETVPPKAYGGTERVVSYLTEALVALGHDVTLFASGDSTTAARLVPVVDKSLRLHPARPDWVIWHTLMMDRVLQLADQFDVIHFHVDTLQLPLMERCARTPCCWHSRFLFYVSSRSRRSCRARTPTGPRCPMSRR